MTDEDPTSRGTTATKAGRVADWVEVAALADLQRRRKLLVEVDDTPIALFLVDDEVRAFHNVCIHKQRQLIKGTLLRGRVICPGHQWAFDLNTGWEESQSQCQPTFDVKVEDGTVYVDASPRIRTTPPDDTERWQA